MRAKLRNRVVIVAALLSFAVAGLAVAANPDRELHQFGFLQSKNLVARTLEVSGRTYQTSPRTRFYDLKGARIQLEDLVPKRPTGLFSAEDATVVEFEAIRRRNEWVLRRLKVVRDMPD